MRRILIKLILFVGIPLVIAEGVARHRLPFERFYGRAEKHLAVQQPIQFVFFGSSRTYAAVDTQAFADQLSATTHGPVTAVNLARGQMTPVQFYLALEQLIAVSPEHLRGVTVFVETYRGAPQSHTWTSNWFQNNFIFEWADILPWWRVPEFWLRSENPFKDKFEATLAKGFTTLIYVNSFRDRLIRGGESLVNRFTGVNTSAAVDLAGSGGIRNDEAGIELMKQVAEQENLLKPEDMPPADWESTAIGDLCRLVNRVGGKVVFFEAPHGIVIPNHLSAFFKQRRDKFSRAARQWKATLLTPVSRETSGDFPDLMHLAHSKAASYSRELAAAYLAAKN